MSLDLLEPYAHELQNQALSTRLSIVTTWHSFSNLRRVELIYIAILRPVISCQTPVVNYSGMAMLQSS